MTEPHGEHHRCARCEAVGRAEAEARLAAVERDFLTAVGSIEALEAKVAALQARLATLTALVRRLREAQKLYFKERSQDLLIEAKGLELALDLALRQEDP